MVLSNLAIILYIMTALACLRAAYSRAGNPPREGAAWRWLWQSVAVLFVMLAAMRATGFEEAARDALRALLRQDGQYTARRELQAPAAAATVVLASIFGLFVYRMRPGPGGVRLHRVRQATVLAAGAMVGLVILRLVSFHWTDRLLYRGPHLNWFGDIGFTLIVMSCALLYPTLVRQGGNRERRR